MHAVQYIADVTVKTIEAVKPIAWPLVVVFIFLRYEQEILDKFSGLESLDSPIGKAEFDKRAINEETDKLLQQSSSSSRGRITNVKPGKQLGPAQSALLDNNELRASLQWFFEDEEALASELALVAVSTHPAACQLVSEAIQKSNRAIPKGKGLTLLKLISYCKSKSKSKDGETGVNQARLRANLPELLRGYRPKQMQELAIKDPDQAILVMENYLLLFQGYLENPNIIDVARKSLRRYSDFVDSAGVLLKQMALLQSELGEDSARRRFDDVMLLARAVDVLFEAFFSDLRAVGARS